MKGFLMTIVKTKKIPKLKEDRANLDWFLAKSRIEPRCTKLGPLVKKLTVAKKRVKSHC